MNLNLDLSSYQNYQFPPEQTPTPLTPQQQGVFGVSPYQDIVANDLLIQSWGTLGVAAYEFLANTPALVPPNFNAASETASGQQPGTLNSTVNQAYQTAFNNELNQIAQEYNLSPATVAQIQFSFFNPDVPVPPNISQLANLVGNNAAADVRAWENLPADWSPPSPPVNQSSFDTSIQNAYDSSFEKELNLLQLSNTITPEQAAQLRYAHYNPDSPLDPGLTNLLDALNNAAIASISTKFGIPHGWTPPTNTAGFDAKITSQYDQDFNSALTSYAQLNNLSPLDVAQIKYLHYHPGASIPPNLQLIEQGLEANVQTQIILQFGLPPGVTPQPNTELYDATTTGSFVTQFNQELNNYQPPLTEFQKNQIKLAAEGLPYQPDPNLDIAGIASQITAKAMSDVGLPPQWSPATQPAQNAFPSPAAQTVALNAVNNASTIADAAESVVQTTVPPPAQLSILQFMKAVKDAIAKLQEFLNQLQLITSEITANQAFASLSNASQILAERLGTQQNQTGQPTGIQGDGTQGSGSSQGVPGVTGTTQLSGNQGSSGTPPVTGTTTGQPLTYAPSNTYAPLNTGIGGQPFDNTGAWTLNNQNNPNIPNSTWNWNAISTTTPGTENITGVVTPDAQLNDMINLRNDLSSLPLQNPNSELPYYSLVNQPGLMQQLNQLGIYPSGNLTPENLNQVISQLSEVINARAAIDSIPGLNSILMNVNLSLAAAQDFTQLAAALTNISYGGGYAQAYNDITNMVNDLQIPPELKGVVQNALINGLSNALQIANQIRWNGGEPTLANVFNALVSSAVNTIVQNSSNSALDQEVATNVFMGAAALSTLLLDSYAQSAQLESATTTSQTAYTLTGETTTTTTDQVYQKGDTTIETIEVDKETRAWNGVTSFSTEEQTIISTPYKTIVLSPLSQDIKTFLPSPFENATVNNSGIAGVLADVLIAQGFAPSRAIAVAASAVNSTLEFSFGTVNDFRAGIRNTLVDLGFSPTLARFMSNQAVDSLYADTAIINANLNTPLTSTVLDLAATATSLTNSLTRIGFDPGTASNIVDNAIGQALANSYGNVGLFHDQLVNSLLNQGVGYSTANFLANEAVATMQGAIATEGAAALLSSYNLGFNAFLASPFQAAAFNQSLMLGAITENLVLNGVSPEIAPELAQSVLNNSLTLNPNTVAAFATALQNQYLQEGYSLPEATSFANAAVQNLYAQTLASGISNNPFEANQYEFGLLANAVTANLASVGYDPNFTGFAISNALNNSLENPFETIGQFQGQLETQLMNQGLSWPAAQSIAALTVAFMDNNLGAANANQLLGQNNFLAAAYLGTAFTPTAFNSEYNTGVLTNLLIANGINPSAAATVANAVLAEALASPLNTVADFQNQLINQFTSQGYSYSMAVNFANQAVNALFVQSQITPELLGQPFVAAAFEQEILANAVASNPLLSGFDTGFASVLVNNAIAQALTNPSETVGNFRDQLINAFASQPRINLATATYLADQTIGLMQTNLYSQAASAATALLDTQVELYGFSPFTASESATNTMTGLIADKLILNGMNPQEATDIASTVMNNLNNVLLPTMTTVQDLRNGLTHEFENLGFAPSQAINLANLAVKAHFGGHIGGHRGGGGGGGEEELLEQELLEQAELNQQVIANALTNSLIEQGYNSAVASNLANNALTQALNTPQTTVGNLQQQLVLQFQAQGLSLPSATAFANETLSLMETTALLPGINQTLGLSLNNEINTFLGTPFGYVNADAALLTGVLSDSLTMQGLNPGSAVAALNAAFTSLQNNPLATVGELQTNIQEQLMAQGFSPLVAVSLANEAVQTIFQGNMINQAVLGTAIANDSLAFNALNGPLTQSLISFGYNPKEAGIIVNNALTQVLTNPLDNVGDLQNQLIAQFQSQGMNPETAAFFAGQTITMLEASGGLSAWNPAVGITGFAEINAFLNESFPQTGVNPEILAASLAGSMILNGVDPADANAIAEAAITQTLGSPLNIVADFQNRIQSQLIAQGYPPGDAALFANQAVQSLFVNAEIAGGFINTPFIANPANEAVVTASISNALALNGVDPALANTMAETIVGQSLAQNPALISNFRDQLQGQLIGQGYPPQLAAYAANQAVQTLLLQSEVPAAFLASPFIRDAFAAEALSSPLTASMVMSGFAEEAAQPLIDSALQQTLGQPLATIGDFRNQLVSQLTNQGVGFLEASLLANQAVTLLESSFISQGVYAAPILPAIIAGSLEAATAQAFVAPSSFLGTPMGYVNADAYLLTGILSDSLLLQGLNPQSAGIAMNDAFSALANNPFATVGNLQANIQEQLIGQGYTPLIAADLANQAVQTLFQNTMITPAVLGASIAAESLDPNAINGPLTQSLISFGYNINQAEAIVNSVLQGLPGAGTVEGLQSSLIAQFETQGMTPGTAAFFANQTITTLEATGALPAWDPAVGITGFAEAAAFLSTPYGQAAMNPEIMTASLASNMILNGVNPATANSIAETVVAQALSSPLGTVAQFQTQLQTQLIAQGYPPGEAALYSNEAVQGLFVNTQIAAGYLNSPFIANQLTQDLLIGTVSNALIQNGVDPALANNLASTIVGQALAQNPALIANLSTQLQGQLTSQGYTPAVAAFVANQAVQALFLQSEIPVSFLGSPFISEAAVNAALADPLAASMLMTGFAENAVQPLINTALQQTLGLPLNTIGDFRNQLVAQLLNQGVGPLQANLLANQAVTILQSNMIVQGLYTPPAVVAEAIETPAAQALTASSPFGQAAFAEVGAFLSTPFGEAELNPAIMAASLAGSMMLNGVNPATANEVAASVITGALNNPLETVADFQSQLQTQLTLQGYPPGAAALYANQAVQALYVNTEIATGFINSPFVSSPANEALLIGSLSNALVLNGVNPATANTLAATIVGEAIAQNPALISNLDAQLEGQLIGQGYPPDIAAFAANQAIQGLFLQSEVPPPFLASSFISGTVLSSALASPLIESMALTGFTGSVAQTQINNALQQTLSQPLGTIGDFRNQLVAQLLNQGVGFLQANLLANQAVATLEGAFIAQGQYAAPGQASFLAPAAFLGTPLEYVNVDAALLTGILSDSLTLQGQNPGAAAIALNTALTVLENNPFATVGNLQAGIQNQLISEGFNPVVAFNLASEAVGAIYQGSMITQAVLDTALSVDGLNPNAITGALTQSLIAYGYPPAQAEVIAANTVTQTLANPLSTVGNLQNQLTTQFIAQGLNPGTAAFFANQAISILENTGTLPAWNPAIGITSFAEAAAFLTTPFALAATNPELMTASLAGSMILNGVTPANANAIAAVVIAQTLGSPLGTVADFQSQLQSQLIAQGYTPADAALYANQAVQTLFVNTEIAEGFGNTPFDLNPLTSNLLIGSVSNALVLNGVNPALANTLASTIVGQSIAQNPALISDLSAQLQGQLIGQGYPPGVAAFVANQAVQALFLQSEVQSPFLTSPFIPDAVLSEALASPLLASLVMSGFAENAAQPLINNALQQTLGQPLYTIGDFRNQLASQLMNQGVGFLQANLLANQAVTELEASFIAQGLYTPNAVPFEAAAIAAFNPPPPLGAPILAEVAAFLSTPFGQAEFNPALMSASLASNMILDGVNPAIANAIAATVVTQALSSPLATVADFQNQLQTQLIAQGYPPEAAALYANQAAQSLFINTEIASGFIYNPFLSNAANDSLLIGSISNSLVLNGVNPAMANTLAATIVGDAIAQNPALILNLNSQLEGQLISQGYPPGVAAFAANQAVQALFLQSEVPESLFTPSPFLGTPLEYVNVDAALLTGILSDSLALQGLNPGAAGLGLDAALTSLAANPLATVGNLQANIQDQLISQGLNPIAAFNLANEAVGAIFQGNMITQAVLDTALAVESLNPNALTGALAQSLVAFGYTLNQAGNLAANALTQALANPLGTVADLQTQLTSQLIAQGLNPGTAAFFANQTISILENTGLLPPWNPAVGITAFAEAAEFLTTPLALAAANPELMAASLAGSMILNGVDPAAANAIAGTLIAQTLNAPLGTVADFQNQLQSQLIAQGYPPGEAALYANQAVQTLFVNTEISEGFINAPFISNPLTQNLLTGSISNALVLNGVDPAVANTLAATIVGQAIAQNPILVADLSTQLQGQLIAQGYPPGVAAFVANQAVQSLYLQSEVPAPFLASPFISAAVLSEALTSPLLASLVLTGFAEDAAQPLINNALQQTLGQPLNTIGDFRNQLVTQLMNQGVGFLQANLLANQAVSIVETNLIIQGLYTPPLIPGMSAGSIAEAAAAAALLGPQSKLDTVIGGIANALTLNGITPGVADVLANDAVTGILNNALLTFGNFRDQMISLFGAQGLDLATSTIFANEVLAYMQLTTFLPDLAVPPNLALGLAAETLAQPFTPSAFNQALFTNIISDSLVLNGYDPATAASIASTAIGQALANPSITSLGNLQTLLTAQFQAQGLAPETAAIYANETLALLLTAPSVALAQGILGPQIPAASDILAQPFDAASFNTAVITTALQESLILNGYDPAAALIIATSTINQALVTPLANPTVLSETLIALLTSQGLSLPDATLIADQAAANATAGLTGATTAPVATGVPPLTTNTTFQQGPVTADTIFTNSQTVGILGNLSLTQGETGIISTPFGQTSIAELPQEVASFLRTPFGLASVDTAFTLGLMADFLALRGFDTVRAEALLSPVLDSALGLQSGNVNNFVQALTTGLIEEGFNPVFASFLANQAATTIYMETEISQDILNAPVASGSLNSQIPVNALTDSLILMGFESGSAISLLNNVFAEAIGFQYSSVGDFQNQLIAGFLATGELSMAGATYLADQAILALALETAGVAAGALATLEQLPQGQLTTIQTANLLAAITTLLNLENYIPVAFAALGNPQFNSADFLDLLRNAQKELQLGNGQDYYAEIFELIKLIKKEIAQLEATLKGLASGGGGQPGKAGMPGFPGLNGGSPFQIPGMTPQALQGVPILFQG